MENYKATVDNDDIDANESSDDESSNDNKDISNDDFDANESSDDE